MFFCLDCCLTYYSTISILNATISEKTRSNVALCILSVLDAQLFHHFDSARISAIESDMIREIVASIPPDVICSIEMICCPFTKVITVNMVIKKKKRDYLFLRLPSATSPTSPMPTRARVESSGTGAVKPTTSFAVSRPSVVELYLPNSYTETDSQVH